MTSNRTWQELCRANTYLQSAANEMLQAMTLKQHGHQLTGSYEVFSIASMEKAAKVLGLKLVPIEAPAEAPAETLKSEAA